MDRRGVLSAGGRAGGQRLGSVAQDHLSHSEDSDMDLIDPGKKAPAFSLNDQAGNTHRLADYAGKPVVLFFYPKDDTPGCTREACAFQDNLPSFKTNKAVVLGISVLDEA